MHIHSANFCQQFFCGVCQVNEVAWDGIATEVTYVSRFDKITPFSALNVPKNISGNPLWYERLFNLTEPVSRLNPSNPFVATSLALDLFDPIPASSWLFGSTLMGLGFIEWRKKVV